MDALSDVLAAVRLTSSAFLDARFTAPWCIASQIGPEDCAPLGPVPATLIAYHYLVAGEAWIETIGRSPVQVGAGHIVLLPRNDRHALGSATGLRPAVIDHLIQPIEIIGAFLGFHIGPSKFRQMDKIEPDFRDITDIAFPLTFIPMFGIIVYSEGH